MIKLYASSLLLIVSTLLSVYPLWAETPTEVDNPCVISKNAISQASAIRGLSIKRETPCFLHNKEQVKSYLLGVIKTKIPERRMKAEELIYKAFGFIPRDYNYKQGLINLYLDQLGGYYDPEKDHFVMAEWMPAAMQLPIAVHELTHALQDQHFDLKKFIDIDKFSTDQLLARSALVEGDATAVMIDFTRTMANQPNLAEANDVTAIMLQNIIGSSLFVGLKEVPESLKLILLFPYTSGLRFAHHLLKVGGYSELDKAFKNPPGSTTQILHPERYFETTSDFLVIPPPQSQKINKTDSAEMVFNDTLGEFAIVALFSMYEQNRLKVSSIARGWSGDRVVVYNLTDNKAEVLWSIHWDTTEDAIEFYDAYRTILYKFPDTKISQSGRAVTLSWRGIAG